MKVLEVPFCFAPDAIGGTEIYVSHLAHDLEELGVEPLIAAPGDVNRSYMHDGLRVRRYALKPVVNDPVELYDEGDRQAAAEFGILLDEELPDLVHLHAFTRGVSLRTIRAAKQRGLPVVLTYHTPTVSCQRGTLMHHGVNLCDGRLDVARCADCTLHGLGMSRPLASGVGRLPPAVGRWLAERGRHGGIWTALRMSELMRVRHETFRQMTVEVDHLVAVCHWAREVLLVNEVPPGKLSICRHGIRWTETPAPRPERGEITRLAFVGRFDPTKGLHVLLRAFQLAPLMKAQLDVYGIAQSPANAAYQKDMLSLARHDPRISFCKPLAPQEVVARLGEYDFLAVPSQWLETGPLVALEAFAAGTPVIGWSLGGIAELVEDGVNGLLVAPDCGDHWAATLQRVANDSSLRARLRAGVRPPRHSSEVARDMLALYESLVAPMPLLAER